MIAASRYRYRRSRWSGYPRHRRRADSRRRRASNYHILPRHNAPACCCTPATGVDVCSACCRRPAGRRTMQVQGLSSSRRRARRRPGHHQRTPAGRRARLPAFVRAPLTITPSRPTASFDGGLAAACAKKRTAIDAHVPLRLAPEHVPESSTSPDQPQVHARAERHMARRSGLDALLGPAGQSFPTSTLTLYGEALRTVLTAHPRRAAGRSSALTRV